MEKQLIGLIVLLGFVIYGLWKTHREDIAEHEQRYRIMLGRIRELERKGKADNG